MAARPNPETKGSPEPPKTAKTDKADKADKTAKTDKADKDVVAAPFPWVACEMAPVPAVVNPNLQPPKVYESPLPEADAKAAQARLTSTYQAAVTELARKFGAHGDPVEVTLYLNAGGSVDSMQFKRPAAGSDAFREQLAGQILQWKFPGLSRSGSCTVSVEVPKEVPPPPPGNIDRHMFEMIHDAPRD
jgi:hypothetical protein